MRLMMDLLRFAARRVKTILDFTEKLGVSVIDLSNDLDSSFFNHPNTPNEHLNEKGRRYVAKSIADHEGLYIN